MLVDQAQALRELMMESTNAGPRVVAVASGKGGVGKTSISVNLAVRLTQMGRRVVLLDADLGTANADLLCDLNPTHNLAHVIAGRCTLNQVMIHAPGGFHLIPGSSGLASVAALNEFDRTHLIEQLRQLGDRADLVLIDTGAGISPNVLSFAAGADELVVVTTPEPTAVTDAYAVIKTVHRTRADCVVRVLVNMVRDESEARAVYGRLDLVCCRFLALSTSYAGHVVTDARVAMAVRQRQPFVLVSPGSEASACIGQLAHRLDRHADEPRGRGLLRRMASWLGG